MRIASRTFSQRRKMPRKIYQAEANSFRHLQSLYLAAKESIIVENDNGANRMPIATFPCKANFFASSLARADPDQTQQSASVFIAFALSRPFRDH